MNVRALVTLVLLLCVPAPAMADAPPLIPVQGLLADTDGNLVNDIFAVTFTLYADDAGATQLWTEQTSVNFVDGAFTAYLGSSTTLDLAVFRDNGTVYLGVKIGDDEEMTPFELGSSPFAGFAQYAGFAADITDAAKVQIVGDVAVQLDNDGKVHDKYTDAEAIAAVTNALANDTTQLEAALGATDNGNTLNHARYTDAEADARAAAAITTHTAVADAHHAKYTDAEARAAVAASAITGGLTVDGIAITGSGTVSGLGDPVNDDEAATKGYVDSLVAQAVDNKFWYAKVNLDNGIYYDRDGNTETLTVPSTVDETQCSSGNSVCVTRRVTDFVISFNTPSASTINPVSGDVRLGGMTNCWATAPGDNEWGVRSLGNGVESYASDHNGGHDSCNVSNATTQGAGGTDCMGLITTGLTTTSHTSYGVVCIL